MNPQEQFNQLETAKQTLLKMSEGLKSGALVPKTVPPPTTTTMDAAKLGTQSVAFPPTPIPTPVVMPTPSVDEQAKSFAEATQQTAAPTVAETAQTEAQGRFKQLSEKLFGKPAAQQAAEQVQGIPQKSQAVTDIQSQINQLQNEAQVASMRAGDRLAPTFAIAGEQAQIERARTIKALQLNSFLYAAQGNLATAQDMADRAVKAEFEPIEKELAYQKEWLDMNKDNLSREDKKRAEKLELQNAERTRLLTEEKANKTTIQNIGLEAAKNGADAVTLRNIQNAKTPDEAIVASGTFISTPQTDIVKLDNGNTVVIAKRTGQVVKNLGGAKPAEGVGAGLLSPAEAVTLGVPYGTTKATAAQLQTTATSTPKALEQINLVKGSLDRAKKLAGASGRSGARKFVESWLVGSTDYTNLVAETNTLRTNVLTMMTDPAIKKFFGPQMSNADVQLMTSAGTTLNPELQSASKMKEELGRLTDLITRAENAVTTGAQVEQAPQKIVKMIDGKPVTLVKASDGKYYPE